MSNPLALIVDDEPDIRELLEITLSRMNIDCRPAEDLRAARTLLQQGRFDLCLTDMRLPDGNGIELVETINQHFPDLPVAVITAHGNMDSAVQALKAGAFDFVSKPVDLNLLRKLVGTALKLKQAPDEDSANRYILLGTSPAAERIRTLIGKLARSQAPVFISGESGTGKELAARMIHQQGPRADNDFIAVNCGAIPQELMESEFFGHRKGSFTGAISDKEGLFQAADGGTLFLDEVADLPITMQVKLLRAIQEKSVRPIGAQQEIPVDVRILSATHKDLLTLVESGNFRQDLFYRINVIELAIPPLRERIEDIPLLAQQALERIGVQSGAVPAELSASALQRLSDYPFPGNVRELENILERATALCETRIIEATDLLLPRSPADHGNVLPATSPLLEEGLNLEVQLEKIERELISQALEAAHWNKTQAAKRLGISFRALRYRLNKLNMD